MNYQQTVDYLYNQLPVYQNVGGSAYKEGLENSLILNSFFDNPHRHYKTIHVAGTNGKGSTSHLLAAILQESGYKTGLYTSPHLVDFRERIRINGRKISEAYVIDFVDKYRADFEPIHPSFFELTMTMAFKYFADEKVDVAVIEVGLGGRLDSTNIITPDLSVITNISLDHIQFLGDSVDKIAMEKAGIIKHHIPVVIGEAEGKVKEVFYNKAKEAEAPIYFAEDDKQIASHEEKDGLLILNTLKHGALNCQLVGEHQAKNANTVLTAIDVLQSLSYNIPEAAIADGFARVNDITGFQGRWQVIRNSHPKIVCDTGHNVAGIKYIIQQLRKEQYNHLHFVIGMVNDKDVSHVLELLPQENVTYYFTQASISRALDASHLQKKAAAYQLHGKAYGTVIQAVNDALIVADETDFIFIGGSNFIVGEAIPMFT